MNVRKIPKILALLVLSIVLASSAAGQADSKSLSEKVDGKLRSLHDQLVEMRRDLHRHPELSGEEKRTAGVVAGRLRDLGLEVRTGVGGHGVVALLEGGRPGPVVAYRADMDAVRSADPDPVPFKSVNKGVRHICGHDIHTTIGVGIAEGLAAVRQQLPGTVKFLFQPAEETVQGARDMVAAGAMKNPAPAAVFAVHTAPLPVGTLGSKAGTLLAGRDRIVVTLSGEGDLRCASRAVGEILADVSTLTPQQATAPQSEDFFVVQVFQSRPDAERERWVVTGMATTTSETLRQRARREIGRELEALAGDDISVELDYEARFIAGAYNDPELEKSTHATIRGVLGEQGLVPLRTVIPQFSEDFGSLLDDAPGVMYFLGVSNAEKGIVGMPHSPQYVADEESISVGTRALAAVILNYLQTH